MEFLISKFTCTTISIKSINKNANSFSLNFYICTSHCAAERDHVVDLKQGLKHITEKKCVKWVGSTVYRLDSKLLRSGTEGFCLTRILGLGKNR